MSLYSTSTWRYDASSKNGLIIWPFCSNSRLGLNSITLHGAVFAKRTETTWARGDRSPSAQVVPSSTQWGWSAHILQDRHLPVGPTNGAWLRNGAIHSPGSRLSRSCSACSYRVFLHGDCAEKTIPQATHEQQCCEQKSEGSGEENGCSKGSPKCILHLYYSVSLQHAYQFA